AQDDVMAGLASLLVLSTGDSAPWKTFVERWKTVEEPVRSGILRGLAEGSLIFDVQAAVPPLLELAATPGVADDVIGAVVGAALTLDPARGLRAWQDRVAARRTQPQLLRAGLQLLTADEGAIPASAFDAIRNGSTVLDALADCGVALRTGSDPAAALNTLIDAGYPVASEWAMMRARKLPADQAARVWRHILATMDSPNPDDRPSPVLLSLAVRELMRSDPAAVRALVDRASTQPLLAVALLSGVYESGSPDGVEIARALRGKLPRAGESLATLVLARGGAPLSDDDLDVLGRAAAGGGELEAMRAVHAAWYLIKRKGMTADAYAKITGPQTAAAPPSGQGKPR
ncbi:MAG: hypothetical protein JNK53_06885, partial [Phycisphaerae bacterium]|nr:hypothetical protein [Phycisphaerae bacterium]